MIDRTFSCFCAPRPPAGPPRRRRRAATARHPPLMPRLERKHRAWVSGVMRDHMDGNAYFFSSATIASITRGAHVFQISILFSNVDLIFTVGRAPT